MQERLPMIFAVLATGLVLLVALFAPEHASSAPAPRPTPNYIWHTP